MLSTSFLTELAVSGRGCLVKGRTPTSGSIQPGVHNKSLRAWSSSGDSKLWDANLMTSGGLLNSTKCRCQKGVQNIIPKSSPFSTSLSVPSTLIFSPLVPVGSRTPWELVSETRLCPTLSAGLAISWTPAPQDSQALSRSQYSTSAFSEPREGGSHR